MKTKFVTLGILILVIGGGVIWYHREADAIVIPIDDCIKNQEKAREVAVVARQAWERAKEQRFSVETNRLATIMISELAKSAIDVLARSENPENVVSMAIETARESGYWIVEPPWGVGTKPEDKKCWSMIYRKNIDETHDWYLEENKLFGQSRLVNNATGKEYFSINDDKKLRFVLSQIVIRGNPKLYYWVTDRKDESKVFCETLSLARAKSMFPETTVEIVEGVYAKHPNNSYAIVPLMNFHECLAMDKTMECIVLLGRMGAKSVRVSRRAGENLDIDVGTGGGAYGCRGEVNAKLLKEFTSKMELDVKFSGSVAGEVPSSLLQHSIWHRSDQTLSGILASRSSGNRVKEFSATVEGRQDFSFDFKSAASVLNIAEGKLRTKVSKAENVQRVFHVVF